MPAAISQSLSLSAPVTGDQGEQGELGEQGGAGQVRSLNIKHIISQNILQSSIQVVTAPTLLLGP